MEEETSVHQDSALSLHDLLEKIVENLSRPFGDGNKIGAHPLHKTMGKISSNLEYEDYIDFLQSFLTLCKEVEENLELIPLKRENLRNKYRAAIHLIKSAFSAENFEKSTLSVFGTHFGSAALEALIEISDRYESAGLRQSSLQELRETFEVAEDLLQYANGSSLLDDRLRRLILLHMGHLRSVIDHYDNFGEQDFWSNYKILFATFSQLVDRVHGNDGQVFATKLRSMLRKIAIGTSFSANIVTIGAPLTGFLTGHGG